MSDGTRGESIGDVRMRGFAKRETVDHAIDWIDRHATSLPSEHVSLGQAAGRVAAADIVSEVDVPGFDRAMMDGFAVLASDTSGASAYNRLPLKTIGQCLPGRSFDGDVCQGRAVRIMTGAPMPRGADAVLPAEKTEADGERVWALDEVPPGKNVGRRGEDITAGTTVVAAGRRLRPQDIGLLSSIGAGQLPLVRQPRVRIAVTGSELLPPGSKPVGCRIADANGPMLEALVVRDGARVAWCGIVPDDPDALRAALQDEADVLVVSGGSSVGQEDHAPRLLAELGELAIHGVAMRPSSPAGMGRIGRTLVFLLPGNPVSCLCAYDFFAARAIRRLGGRSSGWPYRTCKVALKRKLVSTVGRVDYARIQLSGSEAEPLAISGASVLSSTTRADGFVVIPADSEGYPPGAKVLVYLYDETGVLANV